MFFDLPPPQVAPLINGSPIIDSALRTRANSGVSVFQTYAHADDRFVQPTYDLLKASGVDVFLDKYNMEVGEVDGQIIASLKRAQYQLVFCTQAANESNYVRKEVKYFESLRGKQIPIIIDPISSMDWFHFHLNKQYAIMIDGIQHPEAAQFAIDRQLRRMLGLDFGQPG